MKLVRKICALLSLIVGLGMPIGMPVPIAALAIGFNADEAKPPVAISAPVSIAVPNPSLKVKPSSSVAFPYKDEAAINQQIEDLRERMRVLRK